MPEFKRSSKKTEHRAVSKVRCLIDELEYIDYNFSENDKGISFDGTIDLFKGNMNLKENWEGSIKVQIKGRTMYKDPTNIDKITFDLDKRDLNNFLIEDGTILIVVKFYDKDINKYGIYINPLLPADIKKIQDENKFNTSEKVKIKLKKVINSKDLEKKCKLFKINQDIQKGKVDLINNNFKMEPSYITKLFLCDAEDFELENLIGSTQYFYTYDSNQKLINISSQEINTLSGKINYKITNKDKKIIFDDITLTATNEEKILSFGKAFTLNLEKSEFNIKIQGTFYERVKALEFIKSIYTDGGFYIDGCLLPLNINDSFKDNFGVLYEKYKYIEMFLLKHNVKKDLNFDLWTNEDFKKLSMLISSIENKRAVSFNGSLNSMIGPYKIKDLSLSILAVKRNDGLFDIHSIWNSDYQYNNFKITIPGHNDILCNNRFMILNKEVYLSDDINYDEMKNSFKNIEYNKDNKILINTQVLNLIDIYDENNNVDLLNYAMWLTDNLLTYSDAGDKHIYFINRCQILKRLDSLSKEDKEKLFRIKETTTDSLTKISCNLLLDNKEDADIIISKLDQNALATLKEFPISKYIN